MDEFDEIEEAAARRVIQKRICVVLATYFKMKQKKKKWWIHPIQQRRLQQGDGHNLIRELRESDEVKFFNYTRLNIRQFDYLLSLVKVKLTKENKFRTPISPEIRLAITLRHLATGDSLISIAYAFRVGKSTACNIIKETCDILWEILSPIYVTFPTEHQWIEVSKQFEIQWNLPHCLGAIDGKHIVIQAPNNTGSQYYNYKKSFSIVLFAICDANYIFTYVDIGAYGSQSDGGILRESSFGQKLFKDELNLPNDDYITNTNILFPYYFVGDEAFPLLKHLLRPYGGTNVGREKRVFNYRLTRARRCIENAFGILASRFRIFHKVINAYPETVDAIVKATICLHNFIKIENALNKINNYSPTTYVDRYDDSGNLIPGSWRNNIPSNSALNNTRDLRRRLGTRNATREAENIREAMKDYLNSPSGAVPWQECII